MRISDWSSDVCSSDLAARRGHGAASEPIYTQRDVAACLAQVQAVDYESDLVPNRTVHCRFRDAGHILGSAIIEVWVSEGDRTIKVVFSGDLGQPGRPIVCDPARIEEADLLVIESTYGARTHSDPAWVEEALFAVIEPTLPQPAGTVIIPACTT